MNNRKGYMLIEIILAFALAVVILAFVFNLIIKLKNKNDDTMVESLTMTDTAVVTNKLMQYIEDEGDKFDCNKLSVEDGILKYGEGNDAEVVNVFNEYAIVNGYECTVDNDIVNVHIDVDVAQIPNKDFDINVSYTVNKEEYSNLLYPQIMIKIYETGTKNVAEGTEWAKSRDVEISLTSNGGGEFENDSYTIAYQWSANEYTNLGCDAMTDTVLLTRGNDYKTTVTVDEGTGMGKIRVCNRDAIKTKNGPELKTVIKTQELYLDNKGPICVLESKRPEGKTTHYVNFKYRGDEHVGIDDTRYGITTEEDTPVDDPSTTEDVVSTIGKTYYGYVYDKLGNEGKCDLPLKHSIEATGWYTGELHIAWEAGCGGPGSGAYCLPIYVTSCSGNYAYCE